MQLPQYPRYERYQDSGVDWLGDVPEGWRIDRLKFAVDIVKRIAGYEGPDVLSITQKGIVIKDIESGEGQLASNYSGYQLVETGDFAMNHMDLLTGYVDISKYEGVVSPDYRVFRTTNPDVLPAYLLLLFQMGYKQKIFFKYGQGVSLLGRWRFPADNFQNFLIPLPSYAEQERIVAFLDDKTAKIDRAVEIKEEQIALLKERKQIIIQEAVTKGLNPDAPMKDSGIDWIGQIPAHWETLSLKHIARLKSGDGISAERFTEEGYPVFGGNGFRGFTERFTNNGHHVLIGRQGALCGNVNYAKGRFFASEHAIVVYPLKAVEVHWIGEIIRCADLNRLSQSAAQPGISVEMISNEMFPYAPFVEQKEISNRIQMESDKIDKAINVKKHQIEALKEYKATLINAAVTGKIKLI